MLSPLSVMENWRTELEGCDHIHIWTYVHLRQTLYNILNLCFTLFQLCAVSDCAVLQRRQRETSRASERNRDSGLWCSAHYVRGLWPFYENKMTWIIINSTLNMFFFLLSLTAVSQRCFILETVSLISSWCYWAVISYMTSLFSCLLRSSGGSGPSLWSTKLTGWRIKTHFCTKPWLRYRAASRLCCQIFTSLLS